MSPRWRSRALAVLGALALAHPAAADRVHVVQPGESLWSIAASLVGNPNRWSDLYRANRDQIKDPARLYPGQRLSIPDFPGASAPTPEAASEAPESAPAPD